MSPAVQKLLDRIASGEVGPANARDAIARAGGDQLVIIELFRSISSGGGTSSGNGTYLQDVTDLTGGGATNLDGVTSPDSVRSLVTLYVDDEIQQWILLAGDAATNAGAGKVRHANYADGSFEFVWNRIS